MIKTSDGTELTMNPGDVLFQVQQTRMHVQHLSSPCLCLTLWPCTSMQSLHGNVYIGLPVKCCCWNVR